MDGYRLTRDDGALLQVAASAWEGALELAFLFGWKPAGTEAPDDSSWRQRGSASRVLVWDSQDYFSHRLQHVARDDASSLARGVARALDHLADGGFPTGSVARGTRTSGASPLPSRASVLAEGLSVAKGKAMRQLAVFANDGGFTIGGP